MALKVPEAYKSKINEDGANFSANQTHLFIGNRVNINVLFSEATLGDLPSLGRVASLYFHGHHVQKNPEFALNLLEWVIGLGLEDTQGFEYAYARYLIQQSNYSDAINLLEALKTQGHGMAMTTLSYLYKAGKGVPANKDLHKELLLAGAKTGDPQSRTALMHYCFKRKKIASYIYGLLIGIYNIPAVIKLALSSDYKGRI